MEDLIKLNSRYSDQNYLERIGGNTYRLKPQFSYRYGRTNENIPFVDPSGGPFMTEGSKLEEANATIKEIKFVEKVGVFITLDSNDLPSNSAEGAI